MARPTKEIIEYRIYELEPEEPFFCLSGDEWRISDVLSDRLHFHNCLEIGFCLSDSGFLMFENGVTVPFQAGDVFFIPRFVPHTTCSASGCRSHWSYLFVDPDVILRHMSRQRAAAQSSIGSLIGSHLHVTASNHPRLYFLAHCLLEEAQRSPRDDQGLFLIYSMAMSAQLRSTFSSGTELARTRKGSRAFVLQPALEHINDHCSEPCNVDRLAQMCHLSQTHFRRLFLSIMGSTPLQYVIQIRIRQACILLGTTSEPITAIAQTVGINSISSFNRNFQQIMGVSPQQYRASNKPMASRQRQQIQALKGWLVPENL